MSTIQKLNKKYKENTWHWWITCVWLL